MHKITQYIAITLFSVCSLFSQNSSENVFNHFSSQSFVKQNKYLLNPTFTVVNENPEAISILSRNSFVGFENSPVLNVIGFSGKVNENIGAGIGVFQQNIGVFTNFGAIANYAYKVDFNKKSSLTLGFNFILSKFNLDRSKIITGVPDPTINNFQEKTNLILQPALNYKYGKFDFGIYLRDFVDYNLKKGEFLTPFSKKSISTHIQFTEPLESNSEFLKESIIQFYAMANHNYQSSFTGSLLLDLPKIGWLQTGYDDFFGFSAGLGIQLSKKIALSYVYESGKNILGATSEIGLTYLFSKSSKSKTYDNVLSDNNTANSKIDLKKDSSKIYKEKNEKLEINKDSITNKTIKSTPEKTEVIKKTKEIDEGFYLIVNVFSQKKYADLFIEKLKTENLNPKYFIHPITQYRYVYIVYSKNEQEIRTLKQNHINGKYVNEKWILKVEN